jgi:hypothetical protein
MYGKIKQIMTSQQEPFVKLFSGVDYPILTGKDLAKGMWRGV